MKANTAILCASLAALAAAAPTPTTNKRSATSDCAQYGSSAVGKYTVYNDLWGEANGSGSQCVTVTGLSDSSSLQWSTTWSWANNPNDVKSYSNAVTNFTQTQLTGVSSMQSTWDWSYTGTDVDADVAYDMFTSSTATGSEEFEVMVWLGRYGTAGPISASYNAAGNPVSIASTTVAGQAFDVYKGSNGVQTVYSFVAPTNVTSFSGDVYGFFTYLINSQSFDSSQYLVSVGAGTEAFTGSNAEFTTSGFTMDIALGSGSASASSGSSSSAAASAYSTASSSAVAATSSAAAATSSAAAATSSAAAATSASAYSSTLATSVAPVSTAAASSYAATSASVVSAVAASSSSAAAISSYAPPTSSAAAATSVAPVTTAAASSYGAQPTGDCDVEYVYV